MLGCHFEGSAAEQLNAEAAGSAYPQGDSLLQPPLASTETFLQRLPLGVVGCILRCFFQQGHVAQGTREDEQDC